MPRNVTASFRQIAEANFSDDVDLVFLTISHPHLDGPIRVVLNDKDILYAGNTYTGYPFDIEILSDDEQPPQATLTIQNIDSRIGEAIRSLITPPRLKIQLLSSADFDLSVTPHVEWGGGSPGATAIYTADKLFLTNTKIDAMLVTGTIEGWDYLQRVWPGVRARQDIFPGLFR